MGAEAAIRCKGLWKEYRLGGLKPTHDTFYDLLSSALRRTFRRGSGPQTSGDQPHSTATSNEKFWALRDLNFEIAPGEVVGIIGRNGAGKSTLLKVLSRITEPTRGRIEIRGRVASLLEVGTGFHPELSGRENIYLNGAILGMTRREIATRFDEIVAFAEVERFLDTPVKRYSSGMYIRLAFSVAAHLDPDILVVDEVLAVGDAAFQKRCLDKMGEVRGHGRTVLFVSHNMTAIQELCDRALLLEEGTVQLDGPVQNVIADYLSGTGERTSVRWSRPETSPGNDSVRLRSVRVYCRDDNSTDLRNDVAISVEVEFSCRDAGARDLAVCIYLRDALGGPVLVSFNTDRASTREVGWYARPHAPGVFRATCNLPAFLLNDQHYSISVFVSHLCPWRPQAVAERVLTFAVRDSGSMREAGQSGTWEGAVRPRLEWRTEPVAGDLE
ncbi:MAG: polysaccharide ABC transporter ATP-binding protein [Thermoanaerobaculia bacterium]